MADRPYLQGCTMISCGLGEDASFDVEFAARYKAKVVLVDPTPRAVEHYSSLKDRMGLPAKRSYVPGGKQPVEAYNLLDLTSTSLSLVPKAIWINSDPVRFYKPETSQHVSHSIKPSAYTTAASTDYIEVPSTTPAELAKLIGGVPAILKMDIEGAEIDVLRAMIGQGIFPQQILVEFDVLTLENKAARIDVEAIDRDLRHAGYVCRHFDGARNYLYEREVS